MISLQKIFSKDDEFFELLEASAEECRTSIQALQHILANGSRPITMDEFTASRRKDKQITAQIAELMCRVSVTALEREDIEALVAQSQKRSAVYDIVTNPTNVTVEVL